MRGEVSIVATLIATTAIVILGRWTVLGAAAGVFLMGVLDALKLNLPQISDIPIHLLGGLPWIVFVLMLIAGARM